MKENLIHCQKKNNPSLLIEFSEKVDTVISYLASFLWRVLTSASKMVFSFAEN